MRSGSLEWWFLRMMAAASFSACSQSSSRVAIGVPLTGKVPRRLKRPTLWKDEHVSSESIQSKTQEDAVVSPPEAHWAQRGWPQSPQERSPAAVFEAVTHTGTYATSQGNLHL